MVSKFVATTLVKSLNQTQSVPSARFHSGTPDSATNSLDHPPGRDWLHLLQHFAAHPDECESSWHVQALGDENAPDFYLDPKPLDPGVIDQRCQQSMRTTLENKYKAIATQAQSLWHEHVMKNFLLDGIIIGAVVGAIAGAIIGAKVGGVGGAIIGALVGAVAGGLLGALVGGVVGMLT